MGLEVGINSYITVDEADDIVSDIYYSTDKELELWGKLETKDKEVAIKRATRVINTLPFIGKKYIGSSMPWPRWINYEYTECPYDVKAAVVAQALKDKMVKESEEYRLMDNNVKTYSIKNASITFNTDKSNELSNGVYISVYQEYLEPWIY